MGYKRQRGGRVIAVQVCTRLGRGPESRGPEDRGLEDRGLEGRGPEGNVQRMGNEEGK